MTFPKSGRAQVTEESCVIPPSGKGTAADPSSPAERDSPRQVGRGEERRGDAETGDGERDAERRNCGAIEVLTGSGERKTVKIGLVKVRE